MNMDWTKPLVFKNPLSRSGFGRPIFSHFRTMKGTPEIPLGDGEIIEACPDQEIAVVRVAGDSVNFHLDGTCFGGAIGRYGNLDLENE